MGRWAVIGSLFFVLLVVQFLGNPNGQVRAMWCGFGYDDYCDPVLREIRSAPQ